MLTLQYPVQWLARFAHRVTSNQLHTRYLIRAFDLFRLTPDLNSSQQQMAAAEPRGILMTTDPSRTLSSSSLANPMSTRGVARGPALVPPTGANEMDLHELVAHIERDHTMRTQGYVIRANGWVDPSTLAYHRYVVLTIEHRSGSGAPVSQYYIRIDRRAERHLPAFNFLRQLGRVNSSDRVRYIYQSTNTSIKPHATLGCTVI